MTANLLDLVAVEVLVPYDDPDAFYLNESELNTRLLGDADNATEWEPITSRANRITTRRGGSQDTISNTLEVGTLTITLVDPPTNRIRPSTPIRVRSLTDDTALFTGEVADMFTETRRDVAEFGAVSRRFTTITAVDAVRHLANTMRYGAVVGGTNDDETPRTYETFEQRIERLLRSTGLPYQIAPNEPVEVLHPPTVTNLGGPAPEAVTSLWYASGPNINLHASANSGPGFVFGGYTPAGQVPTGTYQPGVDFIARPLTGLVPGATYTITVDRVTGWDQHDVALGIVGKSWAVSHYTPFGYPPVTYSFVATATTHDLFIGPGEPWTVPADVSWVWSVAGDWEDTTWLAPTLTVSLSEQRMPWGQSWMLQDIVYESTLANHLDLAVNTIRGRWFVDRDGVVQASREEGFTLPAATFSDAPAGRPATASYVGVSLAFDTQRIVNTVELNNHGRTFDPDTGGPIADDVTYSATDVTSIATNGARVAEVETSIYDPPIPASLYYGAGQDLARSYVADYATAAERISAVRLHTTKVPDLVTALEVFDPIDVEHEDLTTHARIVAIEHEITPDDWHTNLHLIERT